MVDEHQPEPPPIVKVGAIAFRLLRWAVWLGIVLLIIVVGELLPPLRWLDTVLAPHDRMLGWILGTLGVLGFVLFMSGILHLIFRGKPGDGEVSLREDLWQNTPRMRRFRVIASGVVLMILGGAGAVVVFAPPGIKLLILLAVGYTVARYLLARMRMAASM